MLFAETITDEALPSHFEAIPSRGREAEARADARAEFEELSALLREDIRLGVAQLSRDLQVIVAEAAAVERAIVELDAVGHTLVSHTVARTAALPLLGTVRRLVDSQVQVVERLLQGGVIDPAVAGEAREPGALLKSVLGELETAFAPQPAHTEALAKVVEIAALRQRPEPTYSKRLEAMRHRLERFEARLVLALRPPGTNERRREPRLPVRIAASLQCGDRSWTGETVDLARGGALVNIETVFDRPPIGGCARLALAELGTFTARIVGLSAKGVHLAFTDLTAQQRAVLDGRLAALVALDAPFVNIARWAAREVEALFARGVAAGEITETALFASPATLLVGAPEDATAGGGAVLARDFLGKRLAPLQNQIAAGREEIVYATCCDRHGYLPVVTHGPAMALAGDHGITELATQGLASGTIDDSNHGVIAARNRRNHLAFMPSPAIREIAVPIEIDGRQWGAFRLGFRPDGSPGREAIGP